jgi:hypothetical protein
VCGTVSTVCSGLARVQVVTAVLLFVSVSVSLWNLRYFKLWACGCVD